MVDEPETVTAAEGGEAPAPPGAPAPPPGGAPGAVPTLEDDDDGDEAPPGPGGSPPQPGANWQEGDDEGEEAPPEPERSSVMYSCLRCNTPSPGDELDRLPEIKCICGFRVFIKNRPPVVKTIRAV